MFDSIDILYNLANPKEIKRIIINLDNIERKLSNNQLV